MTYVLIISNTGQWTATSVLLRDDFPPGVDHAAGTAQAVLVGGGVVSTTFTDAASYVEWEGFVPTATGLLITVPVQVVASPGDYVVNNVIVSDTRMFRAAVLTAETQVYLTDTLFYYESFNLGPGQGWQGNEDWQWGVPLAPLDHPHSGPGAWGTNLVGDYAENRMHVLTGTIDLAGIPENKTVWLQWWEWFEGGGAPDAGLLKIDGDTLYEVDINRTVWTERELNITDQAYASSQLSVTFVLTTSGVASVGAGWYVDDVAVHTYPPSAEFAGSWKRVDRTKVAPGGRLTYTFYITNSGYATSTHGRMYDELPPGLWVSNVSHAGAGQVVSGDDFVEWYTSHAAPMPVGADATITVVVDVSPTLACGTILLANSALITESEARLEIPLQAPTVGVYPGDVRYASLFDADDGGLTAQGAWQWGETEAYGDGPAWDGQPFHSGPNVWGTFLGASVTDTSAAAYTLTLSADLAQAGQFPVTLQWWDWYESGDAGHAGTVLVSSTRSPTPLAIYQVSEDQGAAWRHHSVELSAFNGHDDVRVSFVYATDGDENTGPGWYIDSVALHDDCPRLLLRPQSQVGTSCRGFSATYQLELFNWNNVSATVGLEPSGPYWSLSTITPPALTVPAAATETVTVTVRVYESHVLPDTVYPIPITAMSGDGRSDTAVITTTATITSHWQRMAPLPAPRAFHAVVAWDDALYVIGGSQDAAGAQPVSTTWRYDPASDDWSEVPEMELPVPLSHVDAAVVEGKIYIPGGRMAGGVYTNTMLIHDPGSGWQIVPAATTAVSPAIGYEALAYDGQLVRLGGYLSPTLVTGRVWAFDPASSAWSTMTAMQDARADFGAGVSGDRIYVSGGLDGLTPVATTEVYSGGHWTYTTTVPLSGDYDRWVGPADATLKGWFYLVGGERSTTALDHSAGYSPTADLWVTTPDLPRLYQPRRDLEADEVAGTIYAVGGRDVSGAQVYAVNERLVFCPLCIGLTSVSIEPPLPLDPLPGESNLVDGQTAVFTATYEPLTATLSPVEFVWNWDDGTPLSRGQHVTHVFTSSDPYRVLPDSYLVVVTATNCGGRVWGDRWVEVYSYPLYTMSLRVEGGSVRPGQPGQVIPHVANVYNLGTRIDSYTVTIEPLSSPWTVTVVLPWDGVIRDLPPSPSQPGTILAQVEIPPHVERGDSDSFTVTVTSHKYLTQSQSLVLTTLYPFIKVYLPLVLKQP
jgi:uncharacterized repeat protein (TIGR01451 family)